MNFLNKMERRFGRYALTNLSLNIVLTYAAGYLLYMITPQVLTYMTLEPAMILRGQVWRIVSWLLIPPSTQNIFFSLYCQFFYVILSLFYTFSLYQLHLCFINIRHT